MSATPPLLTFYGDDFTGSTDAIDALARGGVKALLFTHVPADGQLEDIGDYHAIGIAGISRALPPESMATELYKAFHAMRKIRSSIFHYKVCSTFDSSPHIGSIGTAIEVGRDVFGDLATPVIVAAPMLGRYVAFGNLFAKLSGRPDTFRIDRHPVMANHPSTPMNEADLQLHISKQTDLSTRLIGLSELASLTAEELVASVRKDNAIVFIDGVSQEDATRTGAVLKGLVNDRTTFVVGSSGVEYALMQEIGPDDDRAQFHPPTKPLSASGPIAVASGSCSITTERQVKHACDHGFSAVMLPSNAGLLKGDQRNAVFQSLLQDGRRIIGSGKSVIFQSSAGSTDASIQETAKIAKQNKINLGENIGNLLGEVLSTLRTELKLTRFVVAGGDTSSYATTAMAIEALDVAALHAPGAPLCHALCTSKSNTSFEIALKGGQMGDVDYFSALAP